MFCSSSMLQDFFFFFYKALAECCSEFLFIYLHMIANFIITQEVTEQISFSRLYCERFCSKLPDIIWKIKILVISFSQIGQDQIIWSEWLKGNYRATFIAN